MVRTQPDDKSTALTRAVGQMTGMLGSFPAILLSFVVVGVWFGGIFVVKGGFSNTKLAMERWNSDRLRIKCGVAFHLRFKGLNGMTRRLRQQLVGHRLAKSPHPLVQVQTTVDGFWGEFSPLALAEKQQPLLSRKHSRRD